MNISRKWLKEFVDITATDKEYDEIMTIAGQKVETTTRMDEDIKNVVVGKVLSMAKHENSDHMWVCQVDVADGEPVQIVTGAQNVTVGDLVPVAKHNSYLPGGVHITKGKLRGEVSGGMLCSFAELGLTQNDLPGVFADGIWILNDEDCTVGEDINLVIGNDDTVVDFEITNNRPDCYSIIGLAREAAAAFGKPMRHHEPVVHGSNAGDIYDHLDVDVPATRLCNRYTSRMVANVKIAPSPKWLRRRLRAWAMQGGTFAAIDAIELFSSGLAKRCTATIGVIADREVRIDRIMRRDGISREYAMMRVNAQRPNEYFIQKCSHVLENNGSQEEFIEKCRKTFEEVL